MDPRTLATQAATNAGVDPDFFTSLIGNGEGGFRNPNGVSPKGAVGPAQLMPGTARDMGVTNPNDPAQNLAGGARYVRKLSDKYGDPQLVAAAYNAGPGAVDRHGGVPPYPETQAYVSRVMAGTKAPSDAEFLAAAGVGPPAPSAPAQRLPGSAPTDAEFLAAAGIKPDQSAPKTAKKPTGAPDWFAAQNASRNAGFAAESSAAHAAPLQNPAEATAAAFHANHLGLDADLAAMTRPPAKPQWDDFMHPERNPVLSAAGHVAGAVMSPLTGAVDSLYTGPVSKVTGLPKDFVASSLNALGPETGGQGRVASFSGPVRQTTSIPTLTARGVNAVTRATTAPFAARFIPGAAEAQAAQVVSKAATNPRTALEALQGRADIIVPGSKPTSFQQTGDMGLGALERGVAANHPDLFKAREAEQNAARVQSLGTIQQGADPMALQSQVRASLDALDASTQATVDKLTATAQQKGGLLGGAGNPEDYGAQIRAGVDAANEARATKERGLYNAVDPNGDLTANTTHTATTAGDILKAQPATAKPLDGEQAAIFETARSLPPVAPARDLIALRQRLNAEMSSELATAGRSPSYAMMSQLRDAMAHNVASTISDAVQTQPQVAARFSAWKNAEQQFSALTRTGTGGGGDGPIPTSGSFGGGGQGGATLPQPGGFGSPPVPEGIPGSPPLLTPTFDAGAKARLNAANAFHAEQAPKFAQPAVAGTLKTTGYKGQFAAPDTSVPGKFFHTGPKGFSDMGALADVAPGAVPAAQDYAAMTLRRSAMREDGTLNPTKFAQWQAQHADAIRALPADQVARFSDAATASQAVADAEVARVQALKSAQSGAIGKIIAAQTPEEVTSRIGTILGSPTRVSDMEALAKATAGNPQARAGLRQAIRDHIANKFISNIEAGTSGVGTMKADPFQTFIRQNEAALAKVLTPKEMALLNDNAADLSRARRSQSAVKLAGSNTTQDRIASQHGVGSAMAHSIGTLAAMEGAFGLLGYLVGHWEGFGVMEGMGAIASPLVQMFRAQGIAKVSDLVTRAMLEPGVMRALLQKSPKGGLTPQSMQGRALMRALAGTGSASPEPPRKPH